MGNNARIINAPTNSDDVVAATSYASHDWGHFCCGLNSNINKWAMFKPVRSDKIADLTIAERKAASYGLALTYIAEATSAAVNLLANPQTALPTISGWTYLPPRSGVTTDVYRITDFVNNEYPANPGYNGNAKPPMSGFSDITIFQSEFGSETKYYNFNFKWGASSNQGMNDTSGIEIPITELMSDITNGTWRFAMLIYFPNSANSKYQVVLAGSPSAISDSLSNPGNMLIRPAGTGQLSYWLNKVFNEGTRELDAIPILAKDISRGGNGNEDRWMAQASSKFIAMPMGEKIKITLSSRFANVSITFNSIVITYLTASGTNAGPSYTLYPTTQTSSMFRTQLAAPSASNAVGIKIVLDFTMSGTMASGDMIGTGSIRVGLEGTPINTSPDKVEKSSDNGTTWTTLSRVTTLSGRFRITSQDTLSSSSVSAMVSYIESLPRRSTNAVDLTIHPMVQLAGAKFLASNYFYHRG